MLTKETPALAHKLATLVGISALLLSVPGINARQLGAGEACVPVAKLSASDGSAGDRFGSAVSISGDRLVVGAQLEGPPNENGAAYVFERDGAGNWHEVAKLKGDNLGGDLFGSSVSISGDRLVVGARGDSDLGISSGSASVFERDGSGNWLQVANLMAPDGGERHLFGASVSIDGDRLVIGAEWDDELGVQAGAAYIFEREPDGSWLPVAKLTASDGSSSYYFRSVGLDQRQPALSGSRWRLLPWR